LCKQCKLPEILVKVEKSNIFVHCGACGHDFTFNNAHRLTTFISKNPPDKLMDTNKNKSVKKPDKKKNDIIKNTHNEINKSKEKELSDIKIQ
jgi:translation initiation factor 5